LSFSFVCKHSFAKPNHINSGSEKGIHLPHHSNEFLITLNDAGNHPKWKTGLAFLKPFLGELKTLCQKNLI